MYRFPHQTTDDQQSLRVIISMHVCLLPTVMVLGVRPFTIGGLPAGGFFLVLLLVVVVVLDKRENGMWTMLDR